MPAYKTKIDDCDVEDKEKLQLYRQARSKWLNWLEGDDIHAIWKSVHSLVWSDLFFWSINESRRLAFERPVTDVGINMGVLNMFDAGFVLSQVTAIRRLTDRQDKKADRAVISLRALLEEIAGNRQLFTREIYVGYDGLPYEFESAKKNWLSNLADCQNNNSGSATVVPVDRWEASEMQHGMFDRLSGVSPSRRSRHDLVKTEIIENVNRKLDSCGDVRKYVDKFVAHAGDPLNREGLLAEQIKVTRSGLRNCLKAIWLVTECISSQMLCSSSHSVVPVPQYDQFENLDKRWAVSNRLEMLHHYWHKEADEMEKWEQEVDSVLNFSQTPP